MLKLRTTQRLCHACEAVKAHPETSVFVNFDSFRSVRATTLEASGCFKDLLVVRSCGTLNVDTLRYVVILCITGMFKSLVLVVDS